MAVDDSEMETVRRDPMAEELAPTDPESKTFAPSARSVRTFMIGLATTSGPRLLAFNVANLLIGRLPDNHMALNHGSVSRRHARISVTRMGVVLEDLGSQNGSTINGKPVKGESPIRPGDVLRIGYVPVYYFGFIQVEDPPAVEMVDGSINLEPSAPPI